MITPSMVLMRLPENSVLNIPTDGVVIDEVNENVDHLVFGIVVTKNFIGRHRAGNLTYSTHISIFFLINRELQKDTRYSIKNIE